MSKRSLGLLLVIVSALGFSTLPILIKYAYAAGATAFTILVFRFLAAAPLLMLAAKVSGVALKLERKTAIQLFFVGAVVYTLTSFLFATAVKFLPASLVTMIFFIHPAVVGLVLAVIGEEPFSYPKVLALSLCFAGLFLILGVSADSVAPIGILLALGAALAQSAYLFVSSRFLKSRHPIVVAVYLCWSAAAMFLAIGLASGEIRLNLPLDGWMAILSIAFFSTFIGMLFLFLGISKIGPVDAAIISTIEPLLTVLLAAALLSEKLAPAQLGGGALIVASIMVLHLWGNSPGKKADKCVKTEAKCKNNC